MTIDEIREFVALAQRHGMEEAVIQRGPCSLRLSGLDRGREAELAGPPPATIEPEDPTIRAGRVGVLRLRHPSAAGESLGSGRAFRTGEFIAYLEVGPCLTPVVAPVDGVVEAMLAAEGDVVGYGAPLLRYREERS